MEKRIEVIPYLEFDGIRTFRDSDIMELYTRMEKDGTAPTVFSDGAINNADEFLAIMKNGNNMLYVIFVDGERSGVIWLNRFEARFARCHWCLFSNQWGEHSVEIGRYTLQTIIRDKAPDGSYFQDMLMGIIPSSNKRAIEYCEKCGGTIQGEIPFAALSEGKSVSGTVIYYTREG